SGSALTANRQPPTASFAIIRRPMNRDLSTPIPNSYWVQPGRLLAGEYPGSMSRADAMERVQRLLAAGVTSFIDLTEEGGLPDYKTPLPPPPRGAFTSQ